MRHIKLLSFLVIFLFSGYVFGQLSIPDKPSITLLESAPVGAPVIDTPAPSSVSRRESLLESPWKIGYGAATTGAGLTGSLYVVTNTNNSGPGSLRQGLETPNTWVVYDPSLDGQTIYIEKNLLPAANTTWDGRDALVTIAPHPSVTNITMVRIREGNMIMHRVRVGPDRDLSQDGTNRVTAILLSAGENYWLDHVEVFNTDDDSLGIGSADSSNSAVDVTVTHYKVYSASKGLLVAQDQSGSQNAGRVGRVTIAWSDMSAKCRNFRASGGNWVHGFNNYSHDFGGSTCGTVASHGFASNRDGTDTPVVLAESSVFEDDGIGLFGHLAGPSNLPGLPVQGYVFTDGLNVYIGSGENDFVIGPDDPNFSPVSRPAAPYTYTKMNASQVKAYVLENAGVNGANIQFP